MPGAHTDALQLDDSGESDTEELNDDDGQTLATFGIIHIAHYNLAESELA